MRDSVLIIDDDPGVLALLRRVLEPKFVVHVVQDLAEAKKVMDTMDISLALLDLCLRNTQGSQTFAQFKAINTKGVPVAIITGNPHEAAALANEVQGVIAKPIQNLAALPTDIEKAIATRDFEERYTRPILEIWEKIKSSAIALKKVAQTR